MIAWFSNRKIGTRIGIGFIIPILGLLLFSSATVIEQRRLMAESQSINALAEMAPFISAVVHELQKERGNSAGFIGSKGSDLFRDRLTRQRAVTDEAHQRLNAFRRGFDSAQFGADFVELMTVAEQRLEALDGTRSQVSDLSFSVGQMAGWYTETIARLLDIIASMAHLSSNAEVTAQITGYVAFLQAKERAGIERAMGSNGFSAGAFSPGVHKRFIELTAQQQAFLDIFDTYGTEEQKAFYKVTVSGGAVDEVERMRAIAIQSVYGGNTEGIKGTYWFDTITKKINLLKVVEDKITADIVAFVHRLQGDAEAVFYVAVVATLAFLALAVLFAWGTTRSIVQPVLGMSGTMGRLAAGDAHIEIPGSTREDEIGAMARSLATIRDTGIRAARISTALETASTAVMLADNDGQILYLNTTALRLFQSIAQDIRRELPGFDPAHLIGANVQLFQRPDLLAAPVLAAQTQATPNTVTIGGHILALTTAPVISESGDRLGSVLEWADKTVEHHIEEEIAAVAAEAVKGRLDHRIDLSGKSGFFLTVSHHINDLTATLDQVVSDLGGAMGGLASGNLGVRLTRDYEGAFGRLREDFNATVARLEETVIQIIENADGVAAAARQISSASTDLATRSESQASSLEETSATMEELNKTVRDNAESAREADDVARNARTTASEGGAIASQAVEAIRRIETASAKISEIVTLINEIAFQTNLLALNAAVEAARAGDAGKGFAVVAGEVRSLAQRSSQASKDISQLIGETSNEVHAGVGLVEKAGESLGSLGQVIENVAAHIAGISKASIEQAESIGQISEAINQMDSGTQHNASLVEQTSAAAMTLDQQAQNLADLMAFFSTGRGAA